MRKDDGELTIQALTPTVGAVVTGLDITGTVGKLDAEVLVAAFNAHHLLLLRDVHADTAQQLQFARIFGEPVTREKNRADRADVRTQFVSNARKDGILGLGEIDFHMDQLFHEQPLKALMLYGLEVPDNGGQTAFVNSLRAVESMPGSLRTRIGDLECRHAYTFAGHLADDWNIDDAQQHEMSAVHPMLHRDPRSGGYALWVNKLTTVEVVGLTPEEGEALKQEVRGHLDNPAITYTHEWRPGDLLIWDNTVLHHARRPFDGSQPRTLQRTTLL